MKWLKNPSKEIALGWAGFVVEPNLCIGGVTAYFIYESFSLTFLRI